MKKRKLLFVSLMTFLLSINCAADEGTGQVGIATDIEDAFIYINGRKTASAGDGYTLIRLLEGDYNITIEKTGEDGRWIYKGAKNIFVGTDTAIKVTIRTEKFHIGENAAMDSASDGLKTKPENSTPVPGSTGDHILVETAVPDLRLVLIKPGTFMMGSPPDEVFRDDDEDQHTVEIQHAFYMQTTEVTQKQWKAVMGENPSTFKKCGDDCPVENVSLEDVNKFITKLNAMLKTDRYRLPTEAEWEYACRAGSTSPFSFGQCLTSRQANFDNTTPMTGCPKGSYERQTVPAGSFAPNALGLYDMHGNVWEWCQDLKEKYHPDSKKAALEKPSTDYVVTRGGSWFNEAWHCRSANRGKATPDYFNNNLGFRLAKTP